MADPAGYDYSQYQTWKQVKTPGGGTYYQVPGTSLVYDPFLSQTKGRPVLWQNPQPSLDTEAEAKAEKERQIKLQEQQASPMNQLMPVAAGTAATVAAPWALNQLGVTSTGANVAGSTGAGITDILSKIPGLGSSTGATAAGNQVATYLPSMTTPTTAGAFTAGATAVPEAVGTAVNGGTMMADGSIMAASPSLGGTIAAATPYLGAAGGALGTYNTVKGWQDGEKDVGGGFLSGAGAGLGLGMAAPLLGMGPLGWGALGLMALGGGAVGGIGELLTHKSTKQYQAERWGELSDKGIANVDAVYAANHAKDDTGIWKDGKYAGQKWTFEKAQDLAKDDPSHFVHVYGNYKTFGNDWNSYGLDKQKQIVSGLVNAGLYKSDKGDVLISNEDKAREIKDQILAGTYAPTAAAPQVNAAPAPSTPAAPKRSSTLSPGIGMDGKRIGVDLAKRINQRTK